MLSLELGAPINEDKSSPRLAVAEGFWLAGVCSMIDEETSAALVAGAETIGPNKSSKSSVLPAVGVPGWAITELIEPIESAGEENKSITLADD